MTRKLQSDFNLGFGEVFIHVEKRKYLEAIKF